MKTKDIMLVTVLSVIASCGSDQPTCNPPSSEFDITQVKLNATTYHEISGDIFTPTETTALSAQNPVAENTLMLEVVAETSFTQAHLQPETTRFNFSLISSAYACSAIPPYTNEVIQSLTITSSADFSEALPAHSNLNSLFDVQFNEKAIYQHDSATNTYSAFNINEFISQTPNGGQLIQLRLKDLPELDKNHIFTLHYTHTNGEEFIVTSDEVTFE